MTIGSSTYARPLAFYTGNSIPAMLIDSSGHMTLDPSIKLGNYVSESSLGTYFYWDASGNLEPSAGSGNLSNTYIDGSLNNIRATYIPNASLGAGFSWAGPLLIVNVSTAGSGISQAQMQLYVDPSLTTRDASITWLFANNKVNTSAFNASLGSYTTNASANAALKVYATNASIGIASFVKTSQLSTYALLNSPILTGTPISTTNATATDITTQIATNQFVQNRIALTDISVAYLNTKNGYQDTSINGIWTKLGYHDTSLNNLNSAKQGKNDASIGIGTSWTIDTSGTMLRFRYSGVDKVIFTVDGCIWSLGDQIATDFVLH